ncbi:homoserine kinase [Asticcacaulis biprosthecium C19]|uniref:Homoserine kinase n=1 Tax=Asticcacaulis biprosthecium C19 TaxID=715226 RepID=F4QLS9_9CAUL|nr:homoserine kinase [Asticcacaulis biprosthecium]EGF92348.1 homoserine kinase [Asticcacaulis biprosthecium C19]
MAVFTPVSDDDARAYLRAYDIGELIHLEGIEEGVSNTNFKVETTTGLYALTLFEAATPWDDLPWFMDYTLYLDRKGYPAPGPALKRDGSSLGEINGKPCALIRWLPGRWPRNPDVRHAASAGEYLARLHIDGGDFPQIRGNSMGIDMWPHLISRCDPAAQGSPRAQAILEDFRGELTWLEQHWPADLPRGAIHADYFTDNVLMNEDGQVTGVIDYYYACTDFYAYDLAVALNAWGFTPGGQPLPHMIHAFANAYNDLRPLSPAEVDALPLLARGSAMRFTLTRLYDLLNHDPSWVVKPKDPEAFYRRLDYHRAVSSGSDYF